MRTPNPTPRRMFVCLSFLVLTMGFIGNAAAQERGKGEPKGQPGPRKVIVLDAVRIEGRAPQALIFLNRAQPRFGDAEGETSFLHKVSEAAEKDPF